MCSVSIASPILRQPLTEMTVAEAEEITSARARKSKVLALFVFWPFSR
jgi:hypothetical protein